MHFGHDHANPITFINISKENIHILFDAEHFSRTKNTENGDRSQCYRFSDDRELKCHEQIIGSSVKTYGL